VKQNFQRARLFGLAAEVCLVLLVTACGTAPGREQTNHAHTLTQVRVEHREAVNINTATAEELQTLPGVGKVIAERIVTYRDKYGSFRRAEHLMMVHGISDRKFREIQPFISCEAAVQSP
jgi:competence ComEA-like helix-hairpin-helix protein